MFLCFLLAVKWRIASLCTFSFLLNNKYLASNRADQSFFFCFAIHKTVYYEFKSFFAHLQRGASLPVCFYDLHWYMNFRLWAFLYFRSSRNRLPHSLDFLSTYERFGATVRVFTVFFFLFFFLSRPPVVFTLHSPYQVWFTLYLL